MAINYQPTTWNNEQEPPISADNLNHIEQGIKTTADRVDELVTVEANPSETPTATMESLEVDGTIYKVGGGHAVKDSSGTTMTQRENLQFTDAHTSDDSQGNTTKVEIAKQVTSQEWENATEQGFYLIGDDDDYLLDISQVANADAEHLPYSSTESTKEAIDNNILIIETSVNLDYATNTWTIQTPAVPQDFSFPNGYKVISATARTSAPHADKILCDIKETTPGYFYFATYSSRTQTGVPTNIRITLKKS